MRRSSLKLLHGRTTRSVHCATSARTHSKVGVLLDHMVAYQKNHGLPPTQFRAFAPMSGVIGHLLIDVWQWSPRPSVSLAWLTVPPGEPCGRRGDQRLAGTRRPHGLEANPAKVDSADL